ncbi:MAG: tetratricopeptide repeat protein [Leptolyngbyaceae cyanobacterium RM2_2_4]|nr:tetratricopeptide repeat protein [Leptolyngbyaceae cyanobacterium RM2_2_4]
MRGMALENLHRYEEAIMSYDRVVQIQPDDHVAWFKRGMVLEHLKQHQQAIISFDRVVQLQPDNYWAWHERGKVLETMRCHEERSPLMIKLCRSSQTSNQLWKDVNGCVGQGQARQQETTGATRIWTFRPMATCSGTSHSGLSRNQRGAVGGDRP